MPPRGRKDNTVKITVYFLVVLFVVAWTWFGAMMFYRRSIQEERWHAIMAVNCALTDPRDQGVYISRVLILDPEHKGMVWKVTPGKMELVREEMVR
jgi:hypothetical protein